MKEFFIKYSLVFILTAAAVLRVWNLAAVPPAVSMDEASIGYNAYSVIKTGTDEYDQFPFISQRGYDDWRRSTYLFLVALMAGVLGLNPVSIRLPAVILSVLTVWAIYEIVLLLFTKRSSYAHYGAIATSLLVAISPWHVYLSRIGHESNAYMSFAVFGLLFFLRGLAKKWQLLLSFVFFTLSIISYYAGQVFIPPLGIGLILLYRKNIMAYLPGDKKYLAWLTGVIVVCLILTVMTFSPTAIVRYGGTSTFNPDAHFQEYTKRMERWNIAAARGDVVGRVMSSKYLFPVEIFIRSYLAHLRPSWLILNSSAEPFKAPRMGLLYIWEFPFIMLGLVIFFSHRGISSRKKTVILLWFLLSPLPGSIATQAPHAMRTYPSLFTWQLFGAFGILHMLMKLQKLRWGGIAIITIFGVLAFFAFTRNYFFLFPMEQSKFFAFALSKTIPYVLAHEQEYNRIIFSNEKNLYQSYMLFLYYSKYDPARYHSEGGTKSGGYAETHAFNKYEFRPITKKDQIEPNVLYIGNAEDFNPTSPVLAQFANLDGTIAVEAVALSGGQ